MQDKRVFERFDVPLEIRVTWPGYSSLVGLTKDFSDGGAFILVVFESQPAADTILDLQMTAQVMGHDAPILKARVVRSTAEGIAFEFVAPEIE